MTENDNDEHHGGDETFTTSDEENKYHPQYHAKIHSHRPLNGPADAGYVSEEGISAVFKCLKMYRFINFVEIEAF